MKYNEIYETLKNELGIHNEYYHDYVEKMYKPAFRNDSLVKCGANFEEGWCMGLGFAIDLIHEEMSKEV